MISTFYFAMLDFFKHFAVSDIFYICAAGGVLCYCVWSVIGRWLKI